MKVLGIDPGLAGGWATLYGGAEMGGEPMPLAGEFYDCRTLRVLVELGFGPPDLVVIEQVGAMPKQGLSSTFKFGRGYGQLIGMCQTLAWPYILVPPQAWKAKVLAGTPKDKAAAVAFVAARYPDIQLIQPRCRVPHDGVADAVCLAHYGVHQKGLS